MEITIFRRNNISPDLFNNCNCLYKIQEYTDINYFKSEKYGNFKELDKTKGLLDNLDKNAERFRRAAAKYLHEYELVKLLCKKQVISRAYFKLYEIVYHDTLVLQSNLNCFFICEAPGGFIECIQDIRRKKNLPFKYISISKRDDTIKYGSYLEENNLIYGDITDPSVIESTITTTMSSFSDGMDFITADGGFDVKMFVAQEILCSKLILCEIYLALMTQKKGGTFVIKFFDMVTHNSIVYYLILCSFYNSVKIIKPKNSRNCNSERYIVCYGYKGPNELLDQILLILQNFKIEKNETTIVFPNVVLPDLKKLYIFNNLIIYEQIKTINESIKMVNTKDTYFQNLLLSLFMEKHSQVIKLYNIQVFKNILHSRIKKCIDFLRLHNININQLKMF
jgi:23S rRNA U2552 (ribose-2'-O)-methylase RlmE/FtsJ